MILRGTYLEEGTTRFVAWAEVAGSGEGSDVIATVDCHSKICMRRR